jgi:hypothetical protein
MTRDQAKRQAAIHESMAILHDQQAALFRELGDDFSATLAYQCAEDNRIWQQEAEASACATD